MFLWIVRCSFRLKNCMIKIMFWSRTIQQCFCDKESKKDQNKKKQFEPKNKQRKKENLKNMLLCLWKLASKNVFRPMWVFCTSHSSLESRKGIKSFYSPVLFWNSKRIKVFTSLENFFLFSWWTNWCVSRRFLCWTSEITDSFRRKMDGS